MSLPPVYNRVSNFHASNSEPKTAGAFLNLPYFLSDSFENEQRGPICSYSEAVWGKADQFRRQLGISANFPVQAKSLTFLQRVRPDGSLKR